MVPERNLVLLEPPGLPAAPGRHVVLAALLPVAPVLRLVRHKQLRPLPTHKTQHDENLRIKTIYLFGYFNQSKFGVRSRFGILVWILQSSVPDPDV